MKKFDTICLSPQLLKLSQNKLKYNQMQKQQLNITILISGTVINCFLILINVIFEQALFIQGVNIIASMQAKLNYPWLHFIENLFSLICNPSGIGVIAFLYYILVNRKLMLIVHLSYFLFAVYIIALLKQAFQQSRPIWYDSQIQNWQWFCPKDFGNPSGHSFAVMLLYEPIVSDYLGYGKKKWGILVLLILGVMVPISRIYLGVHSLNQILFGLSTGLVSLVLFKYVYQKALYQFFWEMLLKSVNRKYFKVAGVAVFHLFCVLIPILFFQLNLKNRPMLKNDIDNLNIRCKTTLTGVDVQVGMLNACSLGCIFFGLLYGFILMSDTVGFRKYMLGLWSYENCLKTLMKISIHFLSFIPALVIFIIGKFLCKRQAVPEYILYCFAVTFAGFSLTYFAPLLARKADIIQITPDRTQIQEGD